MSDGERKIIFEAVVGSKLYGTNRPESDDDFLGVFLPSREDLLGLGNPPTEWSMGQKVSDGERNTVGDTDRKFFSLKRFFQLASEGQSIALELLFVPDDKIITKTPEWDIVMAHRDLFLSRNGIRPFIGFALAQSYKAQHKGANYNKILEIIAKIDNPFKGTRLWRESRDRLDDHLDNILTVPGKAKFAGVEVDCTNADDGTVCIEVAGRQFNYGLSVKKFYDSLHNMRDKYGSRSKAAGEQGQDFKAIGHAYRLLGEANEFLTTGKISFPRPDADFLKKVRSGQYEADYHAEITARIDQLRAVSNASELKEKPNWSKLNQLHMDIVSEHVF